MSSPGILPKLEAKRVQGQRITNVSRFGKYIIFKLEVGYLISHLRMTGQWHLSEKETLPTSTSYFRWGLPLRRPTGDFCGFLWFKDMRKFGTLEWTPTLTEYPPFKKLGEDGLNLDKEKTILNTIVIAGKSRRSIKNLLLDQSIIAGVGNIYSAEVLYEVGLDPTTPARDVMPSKIKELCLKLCAIFYKSIELGGSSVSDYTGGRYQDVLKVYGREGEPCVVCETKIAKIIQAGRSTFYCPNCQGVTNGNY